MPGDAKHSDEPWVQYRSVGKLLASAAEATGASEDAMAKLAEGTGLGGSEEGGGRGRALGRLVQRAT